jgi:hypothetical protein
LPDRCTDKRACRRITNQGTHASADGCADISAKYAASVFPRDTSDEIPGVFVRIHAARGSWYAGAAPVAATDCFNLVKTNYSHDSSLCKLPRLDNNNAVVNQ